jgi:hypothetical protein
MFAVLASHMPPPPEGFTPPVLWGVEEWVLAKAALQERWPAARADMVELYERFNESDDGSLRAEPEYLLTLVR